MGSVQSPADRVARLSGGQLHVLRLVSQHHNSKEIAAMLGISRHTVDQRVRGAIRALGVENRWEAARAVPDAHNEDADQRLIHQPSDIDAAAHCSETDEAISFQIRHADRAKGGGAFGLETEQSPEILRPSLVLPWSTTSNPRNAMSVGQRLLWIVTIAMGSALSAGIYLAGLESLARLARP
jgi:DNA-binding CsgD family transcriptional regulator